MKVLIFTWMGWGGVKEGTIIATKFHKLINAQVYS